MFLYGLLCLLMVINGSVSLNVTIYYEALCYDSVSFVRHQLYPNFSELRSYINIEFVPFGKAFIDDTHPLKPISCQHGPDECMGNKYLACIMDQKKGQDIEVQLVKCVMSQISPLTAKHIETCATLHQYNFTEVKNCYDGPKGHNLILSMGKKTMDLNPALSFVPTIVYDGQYNDRDQWASLADFRAVVCRKLTTKPAICAVKQNPNPYYYG